MDTKTSSQTGTATALPPYFVEYRLDKAPGKSFIDELVKITNVSVTVYDSKSEILKKSVSAFIKKNTSFDSLKNKFDEQKKKYKNFIDGYEDKLNTAFNVTSSQLMSMSFSKIKLSITDSKSIFYRIDNLNGFKVRYEVFFSDTNLRVAFSVYKDDKLFARDIGDYNEMFTALFQITELKDTSKQTSREKNNVSSVETAVIV